MLHMLSKYNNDYYYYDKTLCMFNLKSVPSMLDLQHCLRKFLMGKTHAKTTMMRLAQQLELSRIASYVGSGKIGLSSKSYSKFEFDVLEPVWS